MGASAMSQRGRSVSSALVAVMAALGLRAPEPADASPQRAAKPAWSLFVLALTFFIGYVPLRALAAMYATGPGAASGALADFSLGVTPISVVEDIFLHTGYLAFSALGALIVSRRAGNRVGWVFCSLPDGRSRPLAGSCLVRHWRHRATDFLWHVSLRTPLEPCRTSADRQPSGAAGDG
jgi:hypothetical protein